MPPCAAAACSSARKAAKERRESEAKDYAAETARLEQESARALEELSNSSGPTSVRCSALQATKRMLHAVAPSR